MSRRFSLVVCGLFTFALLLAGAGQPVSAGEASVEKKPRVGLGQTCGAEVGCKKGLFCGKSKQERICKKRSKTKSGAVKKGKKGHPKKGTAATRTRAKKRGKNGWKVSKTLRKTERTLENFGKNLDGVGRIEEGIMNLGRQLLRLTQPQK